MLRAERAENVLFVPALVTFWVYIKRYAICIAPQVNYSTSEVLSMDHTAFYTVNTPCRLYRVVSQGAPRLNEQL